MRKLVVFLLLFVVSHVMADSMQVVPMVKHKAATFYVNVTIAGQLSEEFMVDTGASHVTISSEMLDVLLEKKAAVFLRLMVGVLADGSSIDVPVYRISSLQIGDLCRFENIEVAVMQSDARCILGLSALSHATPFTFSVDPPQLQLSNCSAT